MFFLYLAIAFLLGAIIMGLYCIWSLKRAVDMADLCRDDKNFIRDVLGLPND